MTRMDDSDEMGAGGLAGANRGPARPLLLGPRSRSPVRSGLARPGPARTGPVRVMARLTVPGRAGPASRCPGLTGPHRSPAGPGARGGGGGGGAFGRGWGGVSGGRRLPLCLALSGGCPSCAEREGEVRVRGGLSRAVAVMEGIHAKSSTRPTASRQAGL